MEDALELLRKWVIDDGQCVTKMTLLYRTSLNVHQIESLMSDFYKEHTDLPLSAMFLVMGKKQVDGASVRHSVICKNEALEKTKSEFVEVVSVNVYSIHLDPDTSLQTLLNANWSGTYEAPSEPLGRRLGIMCDQAMEAFDNTYKKHSKIVFSTHRIPPFMAKVKKVPKALAKSIVCKSDQHSLKDAFARAVKNTEAPEAMEVDQETSRKRLAEAVPEKLVGKKPKIEEPVNSTEPVKTKAEPTKESKKQVVKKEAKPAPAKKSTTQKPKTETKKPAARKTESKKKVPESNQPKLKLQPTPLASKTPDVPTAKSPDVPNSKDPFSSESDASSSDDEIPVQRRRTVRKAFIDDDEEDEKPAGSELPKDVPRAKFDEDSDVDDQEPVGSKSPDDVPRAKFDNDSDNGCSNFDDQKEDVPPNGTFTQSTPGKIMVKKEVTETFTDEDGMLVTRVVNKLMEVDEPDPVDQKPAAPLKPKNAVAPKKPPKKLPANQKSISSFFKKA